MAGSQWQAAALAGTPGPVLMGQGGPIGGAGAASSSHPPSGVYVGEGMAPVPKKLAEKIHRWEYVEMGELLPEFWAGPKEEGESKSTQSRRPRKVTDITTWAQCFATYVSVLGPRNPAAVPELMAHMTNILRASQDFEGLAWERYDAAFRRQAAAMGNRAWSRINGSLYSICFSSCTARRRDRCELCLGTTHTTNQCALQGNPDPELDIRVKAVESVLVALAPKSGASGSAARPAEGHGSQPSNVCRLWNRNSCSFPRCRFVHMCSTCGGPHQAVYCHNSRPTPHKAGTQSHGRLAAGRNGGKPY